MEVLHDIRSVKKKRIFSFIGLMLSDRISIRIEMGRLSSYILRIVS